MAATPFTPVSTTGMPVATQAWPPVFGICGHSNSGKTTLSEELVRHLSQSGLTVGYVKHCHDDMSIDGEGKDTDKLFRAGAIVVGHGESEVFLRRREPRDLRRAIGLLGHSVDLVLVEGHKASPVCKLWALSPGESAPPANVANVVACLPFSRERFGAARVAVEEWLAQQYAQVPLAVGVLVGGMSRRMGRAKAMLPYRGGVLLDHVVGVAARVAKRVVLLGGAGVPQSQQGRHRLSDVPGVSGPLAGILAAFRWAPDHRWIIMPCDLPRLEEEALHMLLDASRPGRWAIMPRVEGKSRPEPLGALFDPPMGPLFEEAKLQPNQSPWHAIDRARTHTVDVKQPLGGAWVGVNTPEEWEAAIQGQQHA